jgi:hypothetical protein
MESNKTGLQIKTGYFSMAFFFAFCNPVVEINGAQHLNGWGKHFYQLKPGKYTVKIYFRYFTMEQCVANSIDVELQEGRARQINYNMPPWMFAKGSIKIA